MCSNFFIVCMSVNHCICVNQPTARQKSSIFFMYISYNRSFLISLNNLFQLSYTVRKFLCKSTYSSRQKSSISCQFLCIIFNIFILKDRFSVISMASFLHVRYEISWCVYGSILTNIYVELRRFICTIFVYLDIDFLGCLWFFFYWFGRSWPIKNMYSFFHTSKPTILFLLYFIFLWSHFFSVSYRKLSKILYCKTYTTSANE